MTPETPEAEVTHRRVLGIAVPIVLSNATVPLLGLVDTGVVGQIGDPVPIGAVGIGAIILSAVYWVFGFLRMGTTGLAGQALGAKDTEEFNTLLIRVLLIGGAAGGFIILLQAPIFAGAFWVSPASADVETLARDYMSIRVWSAPAAIALFGITGWLIAAERTRAVLVLQIWMNGINILLDLVFVLGFGWGVSGVALATFLAEWSGLGLGLWFCRGAFQPPGWLNWTRVFDRARLWRMASVNSDILLRSLLLQSIFISFLFFGSELGDVTLAANQILLQFLHLTAYALDGFAFAAEALVAQAAGAGAVQRLRRASLLSSVWGLGAAALMSVAFFVAGEWIIDTLTTSEDVRVVARVFLPWMVVMPLLGVASFMLDGIFIGATRTADMRNMMLISALIYWAAVLTLMPAFGNMGLWLALGISFVARGATLALRYPALERSIARPA